MEFGQLCRGKGVFFDAFGKLWLIFFAVQVEKLQLVFVGKLVNLRTLF